jgi:hypothetical protein
MKAFIIACLALVLQVQGIYFYLEKGMEKCFRDEVVKNFVSLTFAYLILFLQTLEMTINILDQEIVDNYNQNLQKQVDGISLVVLNSEDKNLYGGIVWPNE